MSSCLVAAGGRREGVRSDFVGKVTGGGGASSWFEGEPFGCCRLSEGEPFGSCVLTCVGGGSAGNGVEELPAWFLADLVGGGRAGDAEEVLLLLLLVAAAASCCCC